MVGTGPSLVLFFIGVFGLFGGYDAIYSTFDEKHSGDMITFLVGVALVIASSVAIAIAFYGLKTP